MQQGSEEVLEFRIFQKQIDSFNDEFEDTDSVVFRAQLVEGQRKNIPGTVFSDIVEQMFDFGLSVFEFGEYSGHDQLEASIFSCDSFFDHELEKTAVFCRDFRKLFGDSELDDTVKLVD